MSIANRSKYSQIGAVRCSTIKTLIWCRILQFPGSQTIVQVGSSTNRIRPEACWKLRVMQQHTSCLLERPVCTLRKPHIFCGLCLGGASRYLPLSTITVIFLRQWIPKGSGSRCAFPFFSAGSAQAEVRFFYFLVFTCLPTLAFCYSCGGNRNQKAQL